MLKYSLLFILSLHRSTCTHDAIERELFASGGKEQSEGRVADRVGDMATADGLAGVVANAPKWMAQNRKMLRWSKFDGRMVDGTGAEKGCVLEFELETPSMLLLDVFHNQ